MHPLIFRDQHWNFSTIFHNLRKDNAKFFNYLYYCMSLTALLLMNCITFDKIINILASGPARPKINLNLEHHKVIAYLCWHISEMKDSVKYVEHLAVLIW